MVARMQLATFLRRRSIAARVLLVLVLMVFVLLCGIHFGGAHHDGDGDGLVVALDVLLLSLAAMTLIAVTGVLTPRSGENARGARLRSVTCRAGGDDPTERGALPLLC